VFFLEAGLLDESPTDCVGLLAAVVSTESATVVRLDFSLPEQAKRVSRLSA